MVETRVKVRSPGLGVVIAGGLLGSVSRVLLSGLSIPTGMPLATLGTNLGGTLMLGVLLSRSRSEPAQLFWGVGVLGSFTTFSAFSLEVVELIRIGSGWQATGYVFVSVVGGMGAAILGSRRREAR